jgi:hypothetical protein
MPEIFLSYGHWIKSDVVQFQGQFMSKSLFKKINVLYDSIGWSISQPLVWFNARPKFVDIIWVLSLLSSTRTVSMILRCHA